jgi:hypothetical protein
MPAPRERWRNFICHGCKVTWGEPAGEFCWMCAKEGELAIGPIVLNPAHAPSYQEPA